MPRCSRAEASKSLGGVISAEHDGSTVVLLLTRKVHGEKRQRGNYQNKLGTVVGWTRRNSVGSVETRIGCVKDDHVIQYV